MIETKYLRVMWDWNVFWFGIGLTFPAKRKSESWAILVHAGFLFLCLHTPHRY